jgi:hypothetical protein
VRLEIGDQDRVEARAQRIGQRIARRREAERCGDEQCQATVHRRAGL